MNTMMKKLGSTGTVLCAMPCRTHDHRHFLEKQNTIIKRFSRPSGAAVLTQGAVLYAVPNPIQIFCLC